MPRKCIELKHHMCDYTCMWNGVEDLFRSKCKEEVPDWFLFVLSGIGQNVYLKSNDEEKARMLAVGDGRPKQIYAGIADEIGMKFKITEGVTLEYAKKSVKKEIDEGRPVVLGPLDMYHLPYLKMYHQIHIPIHYILMVGYDDEKSCVYIYDCGRADLQEVPYEDLEKAWDIEKNDVGNAHGFIKVSFDDRERTLYEITDRCMKHKAKEQLEAKVGFVGVKAFRKLAKEFPAWPQELSLPAYEAALRNLIQFSATVPYIPNCLNGIPEKDDPGIVFKGNCDKMGNLLIWMGEKYEVQEWIEAGKLFGECGELFAEITQHLVYFLLEQEDKREVIPKLYLKIADKEEAAYQLCLKVGGKIS